MTAYTVRWEIDVEADSAREAVEQAMEMLPAKGNDSTATIFDVYLEEEAGDPNAEPQTIDARKECE